jgi:hypothetical protein
MNACRGTLTDLFTFCFLINHLPLLFKSPLHGQKDRVFFSGHLNLRTTPETGLPSRKKNHNKLKKTER